MANSIKGSSRKEIVNALRALGENMLSQGEPTAVVAVGGTALILQNIVERTTRDVDIIAIGRHLGEGEPTEIESPDPFPEALVLAISKVARDFGLPDDWMNSTIDFNGKQAYHLDSPKESIGRNSMLYGLALPIAMT